MDIRKVMKERGVTVQELAEKLGVTQSSLNQSISGNPSVRKLESLAEAIGCKVGDFFESSESSSEKEFQCPFWKAGIEINVKGQK